MNENLSYFLQDKIFFLFGAEIEFYILVDEILDLKSLKIQQLYQKLVEFAKNNGFIIDGISKEDGINQFEIQFQPTDCWEDLADNIIKIKNKIANSIEVDFSAKPFDNQPGSSIHYHIALYSETTGSLFLNQKILYNAIGGLLKNMPKDIKIFAPTKNCLKRYIPNNCGKHIHYPTNYSWGFNNRTCALRIPNSSGIHPQNTRIEHRLSSPVSDPHKCLEAIVDSVTQGILDNSATIEPIYGNAFDYQYNFIEKIIK